LIPADIPPGPVEIRTVNNGVTSAPVSATLAAAAPAFFSVPGESDDEGVNFIAALHANGSPATAVIPGETVALFGTGFGATTPAAPNGQLLSAPLPLIQNVQVIIGGQSAPVTFAGLVAPGLYQVNVVVPAVGAQYDFFPPALISRVPLTMSISGASTQASGYLGFDWAALQ
jgi:uncharacterized protein (TIGR03437 family)